MVSETAPSSLFLGGVLSPSSALLSSTVTVGYIALFVALLCVCVVIGHLLEENRWANESITALLLGLCAGFLTLVLSKWHSSRLLTFDDELFFIYLLPPIIFNAGFQVKKKQFFRNFSMILLFGVLGTLISFCFISVGSFFLFKEIGVTSFATQDILAIGAIFSATDSVCTLQILNQEQTPLLYSLVFGEGVVNDATSVVLFNAVQQLSFDNIDAIIALKLLGTFLYLFFTSTALGIAAGLLSAYTIKKLCFGRHSTDREVAMMFLVAYLSYLLAQLCSLSGILTIFFCGIIMSHYTWHNVTENSRITTRHAFATISFISEIFIFLCVGMDALDIDKWKESDGSVRTTIAVSGILLALLMVGRAAFVFPLAYLANCFRSTMKVDLCQQFIIWWAGLMRGAVTIALSYEQFGSSSKDGAFIITNSIIVVLFSTVATHEERVSELEAQLRASELEIQRLHRVIAELRAEAQRLRTSGASSSRGPSTEDEEVARLRQELVAAALRAEAAEADLRIRVFGSITKPLIQATLFQHLKTVCTVDIDPPSLEDIRLLFLENGVDESGNNLQNRSSGLRLIIMHPTSAAHYFWRKFDDRYMRPVFGGRGFMPFLPSSPTSVSNENN